MPDPFVPWPGEQDCLFITSDSVLSSARQSVRCGGFDISASSVGTLDTQQFCSYSKHLSACHMPGTVVGAGSKQETAHMIALPVLVDLTF